MAVASSKPQLSLVTHIRSTYGHTSCGPYKPTLPWQEYALTWNGTGALENDPQAVSWPQAVGTYLGLSNRMYPLVN